VIPAGGFRDYATGGPELGVMRWLVARDKDAEARARPSGSMAPARNCFLGPEIFVVRMHHTRSRYQDISYEGPADSVLGIR
jgi:hypothetical protein